MDKSAFPRVLNLEDPYDFFIAQTFQTLTEGELRDLHTAWQAALKRAAPYLDHQPMCRARTWANFQGECDCGYEQLAQAIERLGDK